MTRYVRKHTHVDAAVFGQDLGALSMRDGKLDVSDDAFKLGLSYAEGRGYLFRGFRARFGDVLVTTVGVKPVWTRDDFDAQFRKDEA